jgi:ribonuclease E
MAKKILVDALYPEETRVVILDNNNIECFEYEISGKSPIKANVYLAKVVRVEPGLQAAFVDYGSGKNGFLPFSEIHPDYYLEDALSSKHSKQDISKIPFKLLPTLDVAEIEISEYNKEPEAAAVEDEELLDLSIDEALPEIETTEKPLNKDIKIQDVIKRGQTILVQAQKEERGHKGASFTSYISLAGKYSVAMPNKSNHNGISRRIVNSEERRRLKGIVDNITKREDKEQSFSIIIRTAGVGKKPTDIQNDYNYIVRLWNNILEAASKSEAPKLIHTEEGIVEKVVRDFLDHRIEEMIVQGQEAYEQIMNLVKIILPNDLNKISHHKIDSPIFSHYKVEKLIANLYQPIVELNSGGYIVINPTEALTSIDVNSGKAISEQNIEETAFKTNLEAAKEIAKQLRLRQISGLIVIDFIDMMSEAHKKSVVNLLSNNCSGDKARIQIGHISNFGLLQMSRQRIKSSFLESHSDICVTCQGKGLVRNDQANSMLILRTIEDEIASLDSHDITDIKVFTHFHILSYLLNHKRDTITNIEQRYKIKLQFHHEHLASTDIFAIETLRNNTTERPIEQKAVSHSHHKKVDNQVYEVEKVSNLLQEHQNLESNELNKNVRHIKRKNVLNKTRGKRKNVYNKLERSPGNFKPNIQEQPPSFLSKLINKITG